MPMVKTKWKDDEFLVDDEEIVDFGNEDFEDEDLDEDEEYVRQTEQSYEDASDEVIEDLDLEDDLDIEEEFDDEY